LFGVGYTRKKFLGFLKLLLELGVFSVEFVKRVDELLVVFLKAGKGRVFVGESRKAVVVFSKLVIGSL